MSEFVLLVQIAIRNLFASFLNVVIGGIILVGTLLFVVGGSMLSSMDAAMSRSITGSIAGHIQVYSDKSKDKLALFDNWTLPDIAPMADFSKVKPALLAVENVKTVVPMGVEGANMTYGNTLDLTLEKLRKAIVAQQAGDRSAQVGERVASLKSHVRRIVGIIQGDYKKLTVIAAAHATDSQDERALERAASTEFWNGFDRDPLSHLEFLENKIAPLLPDADFIFFSYVGTDLDAFRDSFDRMQIVDGQMVPTGNRGLLLSKYVYESQFKLKTAYRLDKINEALQEQGKKLAEDPDLQLMVKQNRTQTREILLQLDPLSSKRAAQRLREFMGATEDDLAKLLADFFDTNDANFLDRYRFFYKEIAPLVELYRVRPGDTMTIKAFTKSGYIQSVNVKVYGTFQFKGLEKSGLAGAASLMDLMTFRDLYGYITPERLAESNQLKQRSGTTFVERDRAEAELFGGSSVVGNASEKKIDDQAEMAGVKYGATARSMMARVYSPQEIEQGVALNAAVILKDPSKLKETIRQLSDVSTKNELGLRVVSWQTAAGNLGQFVFVAKVALYFAVFIIFVVALVIINNAVMMATLQRVREIGTMRAIGAQRSFVLKLVLIETLFLGLSFGAVGTFLGALIVKWIGKAGIPAGNEFLYFFFSGPRLYVELGLGSLIGALIVISLVTSISALYPAIVATRVSPIRAMQSED